MIREKIARIIKEEISKKLKESRADQIRRELDNAVNGTDYGYTPKDTGEDSTVARGRGLEVDDAPVKETLPPKIQYWPNGNEKFVIYRNSKGQLHRIGGPAVESFYDTGEVASKQYLINGKFQRTDGPAYETFTRDGRVLEQEFYFNDKYMTKKEFEDETGGRFANLEVDEPTEKQPEETLPPKIYYWPNGNKERVIYRNSKGQIHRTNGPAIEDFYRSGEVYSREFVVNNQSHRTDGPAHEVLDRDGNVIRRKYFINGKHLTKEEFKKATWHLNRDETAERDETDERFAALEVDPPKERDIYKFTKNRKPESDPRFKALEIDGESEGTKPYDDPDIEARGRGLEIDDTNEYQIKEGRFKKSSAVRKLTEKKVRLNAAKTRLVLI